jgi:probable phosphoglycerate mutase
MSTQILFIRHGETDWNRIKRIQGHIDIPLATTGIEQAQRLAQRLADEAAQGKRLDAIYSSDLQRAQQTAQPIATALGLPLQLREGLRERSYGAFEGYDRDQIAERYPDEFEYWQTRDGGFAPPDGESMRAFYHRVMETVTPIVAAHPGGRIACVAHGRGATRLRVAQHERQCGGFCCREGEGGVLGGRFASGYAERRRHVTTHSRTGSLSG